MTEAREAPSTAMQNALAELWRLRRPGPNNLLGHPAFIRLREICRDTYSNAGRTGPFFALSNALRALGIPCEMRDAAVTLEAPLEGVAKKLDAAFRATNARRIHLVPLDLADELPRLEFGPAKLCRLRPDELRELIDDLRLKRSLPRESFDAERFASFQWLVIEELEVLNCDPDVRAVPILFMDMGEDLGRIQPHIIRFPKIVEEVLFFLLLAPWESWSTNLEVEWRGFKVPWIYTADSDIFVQPNPPPSPDSLSWEPFIYPGADGDTYEDDRPVQLSLDDDAAAKLTSWGQAYWSVVQLAKESVLFETPIIHFFVRAFLAEGMDEYLAHITAIEAALGLPADYVRNLRPMHDRHKNMGATKRMQRRIAGLLGDPEYGAQYVRLFNNRSAYLHGRTMADISSDDRNLARSLARRVVVALIQAAQKGGIISREAFLEDMLNRGCLLLEERKAQSSNGNS